MSHTTGVVYVLDGAGGYGWTPFILRRMLTHLPYDVYHFRWGRCLRIISDLTDRENVWRKSHDLARLIGDYRDKNRNHKIYLVAKSAGAVVALRALEQVESGSVESGILLSPAVSPQFPLSRALRAIRRDLVSFWSPIDLFWLGLGTSVFGTADGVSCKAAGLVGFKIPSEQELSKEYSKLRQIRWEPSMARLMHLGGHSGNSMPPFLRKHVVPLLAPDR
jgi:alpha-beta hydrolase superfamily lysophospholipase